MFSDALWKTQTALHGKNNNMLLPCLLVGATGTMVLYKHFTDEEDGDPIKHFLLLIMIHMLPLVFLEMKILACPDPMAMLSRFGVKVLLMHACFLGLRVLAWLLLGIGLSGMWNLIGFLAVCGVLHSGFNFCLADLRAHEDIGCLLLIAVIGALTTVLLDFQREESFLDMTVFTTYSYIELLSFVPAVWIVYQTAKNKEDTAIVGTASVRRQTAFFFAFLVPFYIKEDLVSAYMVGGDACLAAAGHVVHFLLLLDFACFLLSHTYNSQGAKILWL